MLYTSILILKFTGIHASMWKYIKLHCTFLQPWIKFNWYRLVDLYFSYLSFAVVKWCDLYVNYCIPLYFKFQVCNMYVWFCVRRISTIFTVYAHLPQRLYRWLADEGLHVPFLYGTSRCCPSLLLPVQLTLCVGGVYVIYM